MSGLVQPFISTVPGSLDSKGRVCIPATYRHLLAAQNTAGVFVCPSFIDPALDAFGQSLLDVVNARLATQDPFFSASFDDEATALIVYHVFHKFSTGKIALVGKYHISLEIKQQSTETFSPLNCSGCVKLPI